MGEFLPLAVLIVTAILEMILSGFWVSPYFRYGIPVYSKAVPFYSNSSSAAMADKLTSSLPRGWGPSQVFHPLSENEIAFREKAFEFTFFHYTPVMHGLITLAPLERSVLVKGFVNWFVVAFGMLVFGMAVGTTPSRFGYTFVAGFGAIVVFLYVIQARTYKRIAEILGGSEYGVST